VSVLFSKGRKGSYKATVYMGDRLNNLAYIFDPRSPGSQLIIYTNGYITHYV